MAPHERRLLNDLLSSYNVLERPVANESEPLIVSFGISLQQIIDMVSAKKCYNLCLQCWCGFLKYYKILNLL